MTSSMLRRQLKNLVQNYSEAEVKVREATSNDPWGPSSTQMADISDLTYNAVACSEIMTMLWKRLKDDKNWRHIHKSLTLLEYLLKTGDDRVLLKMKENIYIVKALTEYRFVEKDGKDQGVNVREKAKVVLVLMEDDEKLKAEREFAVKTREKTSKGSAASSADNVKDPSYKPVYVPGATGLPCLDNIPSVADLTASFAARKEERLRQEAEKKETERRAKMSDDELKWEDAGKGNNLKKDAWGGEKAEEEEKEEEEVKPDPWEATKKPSSDPWGAPAKTEDPFAPAKTDEDPFAPAKTDEDPFAVPEDKPDPFTASNDPFDTTKDTSDSFSAPKDKEDPFAAPKVKPDPFSSANGDPFIASKDDPFNTPKDDPFVTPKEDPFNSPKDDPFNAPKDDPFNAPKVDPFSTPKGDPFSAPNDDPFETPKDDPFGPTKDDPFNSPKDDPFNTSKDDPFSAPKNDPFITSPDDPFTAPASTVPKEESEPTLSKVESFTSPTTPPKDTFPSPTRPVQDDPFAAPTTPPKEDPFTMSPTSTEDDPFAVPSSPSKKDPFTVPSSPPEDPASDPFSAPPVGSPQENADTWGAPTSPPPTTGSDAWGAPHAPTETKDRDPWGDGTSASSPADNSDPFGDSSKPDNDPWGASASPPASTDDAWGTPAPPSDFSPSSDPFGDGASKSNDPWGAPSNTGGSGAGKQTAKEEEMCRKTASFLGSAGASLVDLDDLFADNPKPRQHPLINPFAAQTQAIGTFKAKGMASGPLYRSGAFAETLTQYHNPFSSSLTPTHGAVSHTYGAPSPSGETPQLKEASQVLGVPHSAADMLQAAPETVVAPPVSFRGNPHGELGVMQWGYDVGNTLGAGDALSSFFGEINPAEVNPFRRSSSPTRVGLDETINKSYNPFLD
ncbi:epsin-1 isoform X1 [Kryptolebias marmoratus]|uniref:epsin-1 isoform X1 n=1 Tax=Kryptolebias marmoratus TaxID=37003 RepID=UPI000D52FB7D|nr:epsin-1 isoform X1 [Kryptolebias marmoratus]XP_024864199.1 epsin-1 isoform X1 [Kryptolebias marmoratus]